MTIKQSVAYYYKNNCNAMIRFDTNDTVIKEKRRKKLLGNKHRLGKVGWNKGKKMSKEFRAKMALPRPQIRGEKHWNWKGGFRSQPNLRKRFKILQRDNFKCQYCGRNKDETVLEIDHVFPKSKGGESTKENFITSCRDCNVGKGDIILDKFIRRKRKKRR